MCSQASADNGRDYQVSDGAPACAGDRRRTSSFRSQICAARSPAGADVYAIKHVLHGYGDEAAIGILRDYRSAMPKADCALVIEFVLPDFVDHANLELEFRLVPVNERPKDVGRHPGGRVHSKSALLDSFFIPPRCQVICLRCGASLS
jgi:hypothetical protein